MTAPLRNSSEGKEGYNKANINICTYAQYAHTNRKNKSLQTLTEHLSRHASQSKVTVHDLHVKSEKIQACEM